MAQIPKRADFETTTDWLNAVAEQTDSDVDVLESVVAQIQPELMSLPDSEKRMQLQRLLEGHTDFMTEKEGDASAWIDVYFERDGEVENYYQYQMMNHNLARVTDEEVKKMKKIAEEEDMDITEGENFITGSQLDWDGVEEELRLCLKILDEVYDADVEDIERAVEQREGQKISWTEV